MNRKTYLLPFVLLSSILFSLPSYGQLIPNGMEQKKREVLEEMGDPYLPNEFNNQKTSKPNCQPFVTQSKVLGCSVFTTQVNVNANGDNIVGDAANETSIAMNPLNPNEIVIGWRQFDNVASNFRQAGKSFSIDGGITWTFNGVIEPGIFRSDPVLDYDSSGNFYYNSLTLDASGDLPCKVFRSYDGGNIWDSGTSIGGGDKACMTIDRTNGIGEGNIYSAWTAGSGVCEPGFFNRSTDGGDNYENCSQINGFPYWGTMAVGNYGDLYICGHDYVAGAMVIRSDDAQFTGSLINWSTPVSVNIDGQMMYGGSVNPGGLLGQASIDIDRSFGPGRDNVYLLAPVVRTSVSDQGDIMFAKSEDGGLTWSAPIRVNDDASTTNVQWFGTMSTAPNGRIDAIWLDTRDAVAGSDSSVLYYSYSIDEGNSWSANEKISGSFDPHVGYPNQSKMGDYFDMISDNAGAHLAWANTFNGEEDVYYTRVLVPLDIGIGPNNNNEFNIFPNPSDGMINIVLNQDMPIVNLEVSSITGQIIVASKEVSLGLGGIYQFDISNLANGSYIVRVNNYYRIVIKK